MAKQGYTIAHYLTTAEVAGPEGLAAAGGFVIDTQTGEIYDAGAAGATPQVLSSGGGTITAGTVTQVSTAGVAAFTQAALDAGGPIVHLNDGVTGFTLKATDWTGDRFFHLVNVSSSTNIPVSTVAVAPGNSDWARVRTPSLELVAPGNVIGELFVLAPGQWARVQMSNGYLNIDDSGSGTTVRTGWSAATAYKKGDIVYATAVQGTIGIGDPIIRTVTSKSGASFDATEAAKWTELAEDPDVVKVADIVNVLTDASTAKPLSAAQGKTLQDNKIAKSGDTMTGDLTISVSAPGIGPDLKLENNNYAAGDGAQLVFEHGTTQNAQARIRSNLPGSNDVDLEFYTTNNAVANATPALKLTGDNTVVLAAPLPVSQGGTGAATATAARAAIGLGDAATKNTGTAAGTVAAGDHTHAQADVTGLAAALTAKQDTLVSGTNIKTVNGSALTGAGNISVAATSASVTTREGGTGGVVTEISSTSGRDRVHTFTASGPFVVPAGVTNVQVLVIGGGGGGGTGRYRGDTTGRPGGGGGAGGYIYNTAFAVTPGASMTVTVGSGGAGATDADDTDPGVAGINGGDSIFGTLIAVGGGRGGGHKFAIGTGWDVPPSIGGSGGGGSNGSNGAAGTAGQGNAGGNGVLGTFTAGGGGGGSNGIGGNGNTATGNPGFGGAGTTNNITGSAVVYAAGGAGSNGALNGHAGSNAAANLGNGGSGAYHGGSDGVASGTATGGAGGSGIVIIRYVYKTLDIPIYANNAAALAGGLALGQLYRTGADPDVVCVVH